jgi:hypothetical protein
MKDYLLKFRHFLFTSVLSWQNGVHFDKIYTSIRNDRNDDVRNDARNESGLGNRLNVYLTMQPNDFVSVENSQHFEG